MGILKLGKYVTPENVAIVQGLVDEFSRNPTLVNLVGRLNGVTTERAYMELSCLSDQELMALAQAIGKINRKVAAKK